MNQNSFHELYQYMKWQEQEIYRLQHSIQSLSLEIKKIQNKPAVHVDKLEYKFDQLKVETLEGTLNIGLSPQDFKNIEDLALPSNQNSVNKETQPLYERLYQYVDEHTESIINDAGETLDYQLSPQHNEMIKNDIKKQLPNRVEHHLHILRQQSLDDIRNEQLEDEVFAKIVEDIKKGIHTYILQNKNQ